MHPSALSVLTDAPTTLAGSELASRVQIAKTGKFADPRYGKFSITTADFMAWIKNFTTLSLGGDHAGLPVDVDHSPEKNGTTEAAGWVTAIDTKGLDGETDTPGQLWATVEWNSLGEKLINDRRYLYLSPSYKHNFKDETGKSFGTALVGVALTNRPFLSMATVSLSAQGFMVVQLAGETLDSRRDMELPAIILTALGLKEDATEEQVVESITTLQARPEKTPEQKSLDQLAMEGGKVVLDATTVTKLQADATAGAAAAEELKTQKFETVFTLAMSEGRITPAQKDGQLELYAVAPDATLAAITAMPKAINMDASGHSGQGGDDATTTLQDRQDAENNPVDEDRLVLHHRALAIAAERKIDYTEAVYLASAETGS